MARADPADEVARRIKAELKQAERGNRAAVKARLPRLFTQLWLAQPTERDQLKHRGANIELLQWAQRIFPEPEWLLEWRTPPREYFEIVSTLPERRELLQNLWATDPYWLAKRLYETKQDDALEDFLLEAVEPSVAWKIIRNFASYGSGQERYLPLARALLRAKGATDWNLEGFRPADLVQTAEDVLQLPEHYQRYELKGVALPLAEYIKLLQYGFPLSRYGSLPAPAEGWEALQAAWQERVARLLAGVLSPVLARYVSKAVHI